MIQLASTITFFLLGLGGTLLGLLIWLAVTIYRNKKNGIRHFTKKQKSSLWSTCSMLLACILGLLLQKDVLLDMVQQDTERVVGTVASLHSNRKLSFSEVVIRTSNKNITLICGKGYFDVYDLEEGETFEFEYYVNSKTIKDAVPVD